MFARTAALRAAFAGSSRGAISRAGLHPLVVPLAEAEGGTVLGSLSWRLDATGDPGDAPASASEATLVEVQRGGLFVRPLGTPAHVARRAAVEADFAGGDGAAEAVGFFSAAAVEAGGLPYTRGAHAESGLSLDQFLLLRVGPFADCWARLSADRVARGDTTAGLIAAERGSARNPGWGCCLLAQARMLSELRRLEEARDVALSALETPFWTFGAPVSEAQSLAQLSRVEDVRALLRQVQAQGDETRGVEVAPEEVWRRAALDLMDAVVLRGGEWGEISTDLAKALERAGLQEQAERVRGGG